MRRLRWRTIGGLAALLALLAPAPTARAQSWTAPRTWTTGELVTAAIMNSAVRDNLIVLRAGGIAVSSQAIGDLLCASSTTQFARLADVGAGSYLRSGGVGACPAYSTLVLPNAATANRVVYATGANTWGESANLTFDGTTLSVGGLLTFGNGAAKWYGYTDAAATYLTNAASGAGNGVYTTATAAGLAVGGASALSATATGVTIPGLLTVSGFGVHTIGAGGVGGTSAVLKMFGPSAANAGSYIVFFRNATENGFLGSHAPIFGSGSTSDAFTLYASDAAGLELYATHASGTIRFHAGGTGERMRLGTAGDLGLAATAKFYFDGVGLTGDTYGVESSANVLDFYAGAAKSLSLTATTGTFVGDVILAATKKQYFDGGGDTYLYESAANVLDVYVGTVNMARFASGSTQITLNHGVKTTTFDNTTVYSTGNFSTAVGYSMATWPTTATAANAVVANTDYIKLSTSLRANKHDIHPLSLADARVVLGLTPVLYRSRVDDDQRQWPGFIAEDVAATVPLLATYTPTGALQAVAYDRVPAYLLPVVQDHDRRLAALEAQLVAIRGGIR